jgi:aryl-alcohol dehydrogenase-like predicted oxidoreductase
MKTVQLGQSDLHVTPICLGTMTFGEQVDGTTWQAAVLKQIDAIRWELRDPAC